MEASQPERQKMTQFRSNAIYFYDLMPPGGYLISHPHPFPHPNANMCIFRATNTDPEDRISHFRMTYDARLSASITHLWAMAPLVTGWVKFGL